MSVMGIPEPELTPKVRQALVTLMEEVGRLRGDLERTRERLAHPERLADQDTLIPIANRRAFVRELSRVMSYVERYETPSSLVHFDVNSFKEINDTYGHAAGDEALHVVSNIFLQSIRESDVVGRLGGDEFGIILAHTDRAGAIEKAEALVESMRRAPFTWAGKRIQLEVAYGIYTFQAGEDRTSAGRGRPRDVCAQAEHEGRRLSQNRRRPSRIAPGVGPPVHACARLRDDVRQELAFEPRDVVFQRQLPLFQALHLEPVVVGRSGQGRNRLVEVAMLGLQIDQLFRHFLSGRHRSPRSVCGCRHDSRKWLRPARQSPPGRAGPP